MTAQQTIYNIIYRYIQKRLLLYNIIYLNKLLIYICDRLEIDIIIFLNIIFYIISHIFPIEEHWSLLLYNLFYLCTYVHIQVWINFYFYTTAQSNIVIVKFNKDILCLLKNTPKGFTSYPQNYPNNPLLIMYKFVILFIPISLPVLLDIVSKIKLCVHFLTTKIYPFLNHMYLWMNS